VAFHARLVLDPAEDAPLASVQLAVDIGVHSKTSWGRMVEGVKYLDCSLSAPRKVMHARPAVCNGPLHEDHGLTP
jgi:hypothetical protein